MCETGTLELLTLLLNSLEFEVSFFLHSNITRIDCAQTNLQFTIDFPNICFFQPGVFFFQ